METLTIFPCLSPNWIDELIRRDGKTVKDMWEAKFEKDFHDFLRGEPRFKKYLVEYFPTSNLKAIHLHFDWFRNFVQNRRREKWNHHLTRQGNVSGDSTQLLDLPAPTPFNSSSEFLEFFFLRLIDSLKHLIIEYAQEISSSEASLDDEGRKKLTSLTATEGEENSFELIPLKPTQSRSIRTICPEDVGRVLTITGVITRCSDVKPELRLVSFQCAACSKVMENIEQQFKYTEPAYCWTRNCGNRTKWTIKMETSVFSDWQKLRVQQSASDDIPAGSIPRSIDVIVRGSSVEKCKAGDRVLLTGCVLAVPDVPALLAGKEIPKDISQEKNQHLSGEAGASEAGLQGIRKLGVRELNHRQIFFAMNIQILTGDIINPSRHSSAETSSAVVFTPTSPAGRLLKDLILLDTKSGSHEELENMLRHPLLRDFNIDRALHTKFQLIAKSNRCLDRLCTAMAPEIYGAEDIKKGLLLLMIGGVEKITRKDRIKLRGDINLLLVGDPGTAKSQLLKFIHEFAERAVLTSGKASTAAGLTASVHKDPEQGDTVVEAGALILADQGICCIDEFEKMAEKDMVAIHEAMEQQSISISKAGIQATMNARASVLAACNPADCKYDVTRTLRQNLRLSPAILSRFDLTFVLLDRASEKDDVRIARHILGLSSGSGAGSGETSRPEHNLHGLVLQSQSELRSYIKVQDS